MHNNTPPDAPTQALAQRLANVTQVPVSIVAQHGAWLLQDDADIAVYGGRASVVATFAPAADPPEGPSIPIIEAPDGDCPDCGLVDSVPQITDLHIISPEIADHIAAYYANLSDDVSLLDITPPHAMAHQIAANYPSLGAAFYRMCEQAAKEALDARIGWVRAAPTNLPPVSPALAGLIGSKDSSWF